MDKASVLLWSVAGDGGSSPPEGGHLLLIFIKIKKSKNKLSDDKRTKNLLKKYNNLFRKKKLKNVH